MANANASVYFGIIVFFFVIIFIFIVINNLIRKKIDEESQRKARDIYNSNEYKLKQEIDLYKQQIEKKLNAFSKELDTQKRELDTDSLAREKIFAEKTQGFPWAASAFASLKDLRLKVVEDILRTKNNPSIKGAEEVKKLRGLLKTSEKRAFIAEGIINYYESLFPWLVEFRDAPDEIINIKINKAEHQGIQDPANQYLTNGEWERLSTQEKYQCALDRYWKREKSKWEIGRLYERFVGQEYEQDGWDVTFFGAIKGLEDMGRDLIIKKQAMTYIVQCKNWAAEKLIHEKHIFQLFGTCVQYGIENNVKVKGIFVASCKLSDMAKKCADALGIEVIENKKLERFPCIKCNIGKEGEKIYHLPFDQQYDKIKIAHKAGAFYCNTVEEAEKAGFRRAFRWHGNT